MHSKALSGRLEAVATHPVAELLECPPDTGSMLSGAAQTIQAGAGEVIFRQGEPCRGLYLVVSGNFQRRTERLDSRLMLGQARPGDLVELAAALGDLSHTYTLSAQSEGSMLLLPIDTLRQAFHSHPPLRMKLLEELAREVSRAYALCSLTRTVRTRRRAGKAGAN
ncbi:MAG: Crp/Fnr family transcriptional regulator [Terracidiphilus sp.]